MVSVKRLHTVEHSGWREPPTAEVERSAAAALEDGRVLFLPALGFAVLPDEGPVFSPAILASAKNASFDPSTGRVGGTRLAGSDVEPLRGLLARFSEAAAALVTSLLPGYAGRVHRARASFRPAEIAGRPASWRKDDTRLHVDSFPANPVQGRRILRLFSNVNPAGRPRSWRVGEDFRRVADRYATGLPLPWPGTMVLLQALHITKSRRTPYDALMLGIHDRMKQDAEFQQHSDQEAVDFPSGSTWIAFTDQVSHAAMAGQHQLEQTFLLPIEAMLDQSRAPLRILEEIRGRRLV